MNAKRNIGHVAFAVKAKRAVWNMARVILFRPFVTKVFRPWRIFLLRCFGAELHSSVDVYASAKVWAPWNLRMEKGACIGPDAVCYNQAKVTMGENAVLSQASCVCTAGHDLAEVNNAHSSLVVADVTIEKDAWVGMRAFIGPGVVLGERSVVGAASAVFRDVAPRTVVGGNPATVLKTI